MIGNTSGYVVSHAFQCRAEEPLKILLEQAEKKQRLSTKDLKKCLKDVRNSHLKLPTAFLNTCQKDLFNALLNQKTKKFEKKSSLIKQIIISSKLKQPIRKEDIEHPFRQKEKVIARPVADPRRVALSQAGSRLSKVNSRMPEKTISPGFFSEIHGVNSYDNDNERIEPAKKEVLAEPGEKRISGVNDGFSKVIKQYTKHLNEARDKIDTMIEKYQKSEEIDVTSNLDEIYDNQEAILHLLKAIAKETSTTKKSGKIASLKNHQSKVERGLQGALDAIDKLGFAKEEYVVDAKFARERLIYALNDSYDGLDRLNLPSQQAN